MASGESREEPLSTARQGEREGQKPEASSRRARGGLAGKTTLNNEANPVSSGWYKSARMRLGLGLGAWAVLVVHASHHVRAGHPEEILWVCNSALFLIGLAHLIKAPALNGIGFAWLLLGTPIWITDLLGGGEVIWSSFLTHIGGLWLGWQGFGRLGLPRGVWWKGALAFAGLFGASRLLTPPEANVNLAFAVWKGWEEIFPSHPLYLALIVGYGYALLWITHVAARRRFGRPDAVAAAPDEVG